MILCEPARLSAVHVSNSHRLEAAVTDSVGNCRDGQTVEQPQPTDGIFDFTPRPFNIVAVNSLLAAFPK